MTVRGLLLALALFASAPVPAAAGGHCYSIWRYPWAQRCGHQRFADAHHGGENGTARGEAATAPRAISLPVLMRSDYAGGEPDELTRARLQLMGYAYAH